MFLLGVNYRERVEKAGERAREREIGTERERERVARLKWERDERK